MKMLLRVNAEIIPLRASKENTITPNELEIFKVYKSVQSILNCADSIRMSIVFSRRFDKLYLSKNQINEEQYMTYHYDSIIHKLSTIKDLEFRIVHLIYNLPNKDGNNLSWKTIDSHRKEIKNEQLFAYFDDKSHEKFNKYFSDIRNKSSHEGKLNMHQFAEVSGWIWLRDLGNDPSYTNIDGVEYAQSYFVARRIRESRKMAVKDMDNIYNGCISLIYKFFNCLFADLSNLFTPEIKEHYGSTIQKTFNEIIKEIDKIK